MTIKAKCWALDHWVRFTLKLDTYENIMTFLDESQLHFLAEEPLDFTTIPLGLHGNGSSYNLLGYLSNNTGYNTLVLNFLIYFLSTIIDIRYVDGEKIDFIFSEGPEWQNLQLVFEGGIVIFLTFDSTLYSWDDDVLTCDQTI
jgi:hypothetical protein